MPFANDWAAYADRQREEISRLHRDGAPHLAALTVETHCGFAQWHQQYGRDNVVTKAATDLASDLTTIHGRHIGRPVDTFDGAS